MTDKGELIEKLEHSIALDENLLIPTSLRLLNDFQKRAADTKDIDQLRESATERLIEKEKLPKRTKKQYEEMGFSQGSIDVMMDLENGEFDKKILSELDAIKAFRNHMATEWETFHAEITKSNLEKRLKLAQILAESGKEARVESQSTSQSTS